MTPKLAAAAFVVTAALLCARGAGAAQPRQPYISQLGESDPTTNARRAQAVEPEPEPVVPALLDGVWVSTQGGFNSFSTVRDWYFSFDGPTATVSRINIGPQYNEHDACAYDKPGLVPPVYFESGSSREWRTSSPLPFSQQNLRRIRFHKYRLSSKKLLRMTMGWWRRAP
eukprot:SAG11_NODE_3414_length_2462_cov_11.817605_2_plen_170_part_00